MALPGFHVTEEKASNLLILIVDKKNIFGSAIAREIHQGITTILVSAQQQASTDTFLAVPYTKTIPEIPEGNYSHMFFVWDGKSETLHVLEPLLQKAAADKAQFIFITDYHCFIPKLQVYIHQQYAKAIILLTGDIFGNANYHSRVTTIFQEAQQEGSIRLQNVGLRHIYPALYEDVVGEILKVGFGNSKSRLCLAFQQYGMTELSLAHVLQKVEPLIKIDFVKEEKEVTVIPEGEHLFKNDYEVVRKLQDKYTDFVVGEKGGKESGSSAFFFSPEELKNQQTAEKKNKKRWLVGVIFIIVILAFPLFLTLLYAGLGSVVLYASQNSIRTGDYATAASLSQTSENLFSVALSTNDITSKEAHYIHLGNVTTAIAVLLREGNIVSSLLGDGAKAAQDFSLVVRGKTLTPTADFLSGINSVKNALITLSTFHYNQNIGGISLSSVSQELLPFGSVLDISSSLFGFPTQKTYMVLFQNNTELRPGGGFIGSYALLTINLGKITSFTVHDVYDADGQLKGHVEPPYVIRRYIPEQHWYLRDSNFDVDFSQDAANAAFFLQQETGQKVDGVVGIDLTFVKDILSGIGPVYVPQYKQTVTAENFFLLTEQHAEKNTFAGSTQKKDFLTALLSAIQTKTQATHGFAPKAALPLFAAIRNKDIVFGFSDPLIQDVFTVNGLSSTLWDARKPDPSVVQDITGINEANIGVNKANYFVTRSVQQSMTIDRSGSVSGQLTIIYKNTSTPGKWPGGDYKNYLRTILPQGALLTSIDIDSSTQTIVPAVTDANVYEAKGFVAPKGLEVDSATEEGKQLYGCIIAVPAQGTRTLVISYTLSQKVDMTKSTITYNGWLFKQPGVAAYPYVFSINIPNGFSLLQKPSWITGSGNTVSFASSLEGDQLFQLVFTQK